MRSLTLPLLALGLALGGPAYAQSTGISGELEQSASTSPKEKAQFVDGALAEIADGVKTVEGLLADAEKEKNVEQIECLTRKLTPMRALLEVSKQSSNAMRQNLASNDVVHADQEFRKVAVALTKTREFLAEAQACVGDSGVERGDSSATVTDATENDVTESDVPPLETPDMGPDGTPR